MKKRNLILIALAITTILVFTQIGAIAGTQSAVCVIVPARAVANPNCPYNSPTVCQAYGPLGACQYYFDCCNYFEGWCAQIKDNTNCYGGCPCCS